MKADFTIRFVRSIAEIHRGLPKPNGFIQGSREMFLCRHGREFRERGTWPGKMMRPKNCFSNCTDAVIHGDPDQWVYCEGYAKAKACPIPVEHAWLLDQGGKVVDPTWKDGEEYFGFAFTMEFITRTLLRQERYGILFTYFPKDTAVLRMNDYAVREVESAVSKFSPRAHGRRFK